MSKILDPHWTYRDANKTTKPGYLQRRMIAYRKQIEADKKARVDELSIQRILKKKVTG